VLSMVLFGLWHGATVTFIVWGLYHGILLVIHRQVQGLRRIYKLSVGTRLDGLLSWAVTFPLISLGWIFFRARGIGQAFAMLETVFTPGSYFHLVLRGDFYVVTPLIVVGYFLYHGIEASVAQWREVPVFRLTTRFLAPLYYAVGLLLIIVFSSEKTTFVYFRF
jgi:alginate O-acetyltransferase complex protein AlgI